MRNPVRGYRFIGHVTRRPQTGAFKDSMGGGLVTVLLLEHYTFTLRKLTRDGLILVHQIVSINFVDSSVQTITRWRGIPTLQSYKHLLSFIPAGGVEANNRHSTLVG